MIRFFLLGLCLAPLMAGAQVFKCVDSAGHTTYSQAPCPQGVVSAAEIKVQTKFGPDLLGPHRGNEAERIGIVLEWAYQRYPFLDAQSPNADMGAINEVIRERDMAIAGGADPAEAILQAVNEVAPKYASAEIRNRYSRAADIMGSSRGGGSIGVVGLKDDREELQAAMERALAAEKAKRREQRRHGSTMPAPAQPSVITSCDAGGCWDNLGGRYNKGAGSTYFPASGGPACQMIGGQMICP